MEEKKETHSCKKCDESIITKQIRNNPWILSTIALGILSLILVIGSLGGGAISQNDAGDKLINYYEAQGVEGLELLSVESVDDFYLVTTSYEGQEIPFYVSQSGYLTGNAIVSLVEKEETSSETSSQSTGVPKQTIPKSELFIWSYCPYGVQAQAPFAEVASLLKDTSDFEVVLYYDGHGDYETQQNMIQACIQELDKENYWDYASGFVENIYPVCGSSRDVDCDKTESTALMKSLGIDSDAVFNCVDTIGADLVAQDRQRAQELGVQGSPTLAVNGVIASPSSRTAEAFKDVICSSYEDAPETCGTELSSDSAAASGNC